MLGSVSSPRHVTTRQLLATSGNLSVIVSRDREDVIAAQRLRYEVFYEELHAQPDATTKAARRDIDDFDAFCEHLLVGETQAINRPVATYRLMRRQAALQKGGFYSEAEFDLAPLFRRHPQLEFLELGRACVLASHRTRPTISLLWQAIWNYVRANGIDVMFGCLSLEGTDPAAHEARLSYLAQNFPAPAEWRVKALASRAAPTNMSSVDYDDALVARTLPPLLKGYLRLGCYIGEGAVIDRQFNSTDVFVLLPVAKINSRYFARFGAPREAC
jgi:L-ornithine Nalpha-acyltransferase